MKSFFESLYDLQLQHEGRGAHLDSLEAHLQWCPDTFQVRVTMKDKVQLQELVDQRRRIARYPDWYATNTQTTLRSLLPSLALICQTVGYNPQIMVNHSECYLSEK